MKRYFFFVEFFFNIDSIIFLNNFTNILYVYFQVKDTFFEYFSNGFSAAEAIRCHENKFLCKEDYVGMANASLNPTRRQVQYLHDIWREQNLGSFINPLEMLKEKLDLYKSNGKFKKILCIVVKILFIFKFCSSSL